MFQTKLSNKNLILFKGLKSYNPKIKTPPQSWIPIRISVLILTIFVCNTNRTVVLINYGPSDSGTRMIYTPYMLTVLTQNVVISVWTLYSAGAVNYSPSITLGGLKYNNQCTVAAPNVQSLIYTLLFSSLLNLLLLLLSHVKVSKLSPTGSDLLRFP